MGTAKNISNESDQRPPFAAFTNHQIPEKFQTLPTPCYVIDEGQLHQNGQLLADIAQRCGCKILLAQKAFSNYDFYPILNEYLAGTEASGLFEAKLGKEMMPDKEVHVFCGAYREDEFEELLKTADHIVFNSPRQLEKFGFRAKASGKSIGLRINPECSTQEGHDIYDPCAQGSRLGTTRAVWDNEMTPELIALLDGLHFHTLCEQDSDALETTLNAVEEKFGFFLSRMKWLNMGGGHHITRLDYDIKRLEKCIKRAQDTWNLQVYLEPGEACALNAGFLVTRVLDILTNGDTRIAILDSSATCHMPDVIEMPYTPPLFGAKIWINKAPTDAVSSGTEAGNMIKKSNSEGLIYRLAGPTCLAGDVIGEYSFSHELREGDLLVFGDMAIYTTCKNNTFNGMPLPNIWKRSKDGSLVQLTHFGYGDFKMRLGS
ncbi:MAG: carboxynorspermidine decarboxylase [Lachnospiraceae bacterium]|nr:carboxynorspermidine decarboxylase [Lachnospiraceae bacterium]